MGGVSFVKGANCEEVEVDVICCAEVVVASLEDTIES